MVLQQVVSLSSDDTSRRMSLSAQAYHQMTITTDFHMYHNTLTDAEGDVYTPGLCIDLDVNGSNSTESLTMGLE